MTPFTMVLDPETEQQTNILGFKRITVIGLIGGIIAATLGIWQIISQVRGAREVREQVEIHLGAGDRLAAQREHVQAIKEYEKAIELDKDNVEAYRRIISTKRGKFLLEAFGPGSSIDVALRSDYDRFKPVPDSEINEALTRLYQLQALNSSLKDDVGLLLDEALILKTGGERAREAIKVLEKAHKLSPMNPELLAELGLLRTVMTDELAQKIAGLELIRRAIKIQPNEARYHFYLARSLAEAYLCPYAGLEYSGSGDAEACAEAIREYHKATDLATAEDFWSRQIRVRAPQSSLDIFHRYARKEKETKK